MTRGRYQPGFASPPCSLHELDPEFARGLSVEDQTASDVARWRKGERKRLIDKRMAVPVERRIQASQRIHDRLSHEIGPVEQHIIGIYWPFRGEPDLREWGKQAVTRGARLALPAVVEKARPLIFRSWAPGEKLEKGVWNIPVPSAGEVVVPSVVIAPLVGFDSAGFRLGYGGGYYDRTLASLPAKPLTIGVGFGFSALETIFPQWHDIPMDRLVIDDT